MERPPLGLMPKKIFDDRCKQDRINQIKEAIERYLIANKEIPIEWVKEHSELTRQLKVIQIRESLDSVPSPKLYPHGRPEEIKSYEHDPWLGSQGFQCSCSRCKGL